MAARELDISYDVRYGCQRCAECCRGMDVLLMSGEKETLEGFDWVSASPPAGGRPLFVQVAAGTATTPPRFKLGQAHGACVFLEEGSGCLIHRLLGREAKPLVCRQFPLVFVEEPYSTVVSASFACSSVLDDSGPPLRSLEAEIRSIHADASCWGDDAGRVPRGGWFPVPDRIVLTAEIGLDWYSCQALERAMVAIVEDGSHTLATRLVAMHSLVEGAVAEYGRGVKTTSPFAVWMEHMRSGAGERWLYRQAASGGSGRPARQRAALAPLIALLEGRLAADRGIRRARGLLGDARALAAGRGLMLLTSISAEIHLEEMGRVGLDQDSPLLRPLLVRYLVECLRRKALLRQPNLLEGSKYLLVYLALARWYSVAVAVAHGRSEVGIEELREGVRIVEKLYLHHAPLSALLSARPGAPALVSFLLNFVASPADLAASFYRPPGSAEDRAAAPIAPEKPRPASDG